MAYLVSVPVRDRVRVAIIVREGNYVCSLSSFSLRVDRHAIDAAVHSAHVLLPRRADQAHHQVYGPQKADDGTTQWVQNPIPAIQKQNHIQGQVRGVKRNYPERGQRSKRNGELDVSVVTLPLLSPPWVQDTPPLTRGPVLAFSSRRTIRRAPRPDGSSTAVHRTSGRKISVEEASYVPSYVGWSVTCPGEFEVCTLTVREELTGASTNVR